MRSLKNHNSLVNKWSKLGFLDCANDPKMMAYCLEYSCKTLPGSGINEHNGLIIPIIFRVINKIKPRFRCESKIIIKDIIERFPSFKLENDEYVNNIKSYYHIDREAEMCALFVDEYLIIYENNKSIRQ